LDGGSKVLEHMDPTELRAEETRATRLGLGGVLPGGADHGHDGGRDVVRRPTAERHAAIGGAQRMA
jgi:hypothetical protein